VFLLIRRCVYVLIRCCHVFVLLIRESFGFVFLLIRRCVFVDQGRFWLCVLIDQAVFMF
jgi:hypothetical protein